MRKLSTLLVLLLLFSAVSASDTNDLLRELLSGNIKTNNMLKEIIARRTDSGTNIGDTGMDELLRELIASNARTDELLRELTACRTSRYNYGAISNTETNNLLRELITINIKTENILKDLATNKTVYSGTNNTGYANMVSDVKTNSSGRLKQGMFMAFPAVIICTVWHFFINNYLCGVPIGTNNG